MSDLRERRFDAGGPRLRDLGETGLLQSLVEAASAAPRPAGLVVAAGDDAAVWRPPAGEDLVVTQDAMVEGEDFLRAWTTPWRVGARLLTVSLSDLAAMGAVPRLCVATLCAPEDTEVDDVLALQAGLVAAAERAGCGLAGGDVSRTTGPLVLDLCAIGSVERDRALRRDRGRPGDLLVVTGTLGAAAAGLAGLLAGDLPHPAALEAQLDARARVAEGRALLLAGVGCCGDLSDGMLVDAARTAAASGCAAELWADAVPVDASVTGDASRRLELALGGGEDFELLWSAPAALVETVLASWPADLAPLSVVGRLRTGAGLTLLDREGGHELALPRVGARHFDGRP